MSRKWVAVLIAVAFVGVVGYFTFIRESRIVEVPDNGPRLYIWNGETIRGSTGSWVPGK